MTFEQWLISVVQQGLPPVVKENCVIYKRVSLACEALNREQLIATIWMAAVQTYLSGQKKISCVNRRLHNELLPIFLTWKLPSRLE